MNAQVPRSMAIKEAELMLLVDSAVVIDKRMKEDQKKLDQIKAQLTAAAYEEMENKNLKFKQIFGSEGIFAAAYKESFKLDNYEAVVAILGEVAKAQITREEKTKYTVESRFKAALTALYHNDFSDETSVEDVLRMFGLDAKTVKASAKRLKGDYLHDKRVLEAIGIRGEREEELDAIRRYRNWELIDHFFGNVSPSQREQLRRAIWIENQLAAGLEYKS